MGWTQVLPDVLLWRDSCNVYAVLADDGALIVDAGSGDWLEYGASSLPVPPRAVALTHYFRDHSAGATLAARAGIDVYVPEGEQHIFSDPVEHFRRRETYVIYDNIWDLYAPVEPLAITGVLRDYENLTLAGIELQVLPLPGATPTQVGLVLRTPRSGWVAAFSAETIHSRGRVPRLAPLQYDYNDLLGAVNVAFSADLLGKLEPDLLLPSLGDPITDAPAEALRALHDNLIAHVGNRENEALGLPAVGHDAAEQVVTHRVWRSTQGRAASYFIVGESGRALILDYGYWHATGSGAIQPGVDAVVVPMHSLPGRRRPLLHSLDALRRDAGVDQYDAVLPTHYHDDHVCGIPLLQRVFGLECWAPANFARLLADPAGHRFPCGWHQPIRIHRALVVDEPLEWDGIRFDFAPMSGHTRFSALIGWEVDGVRFVHAGDQYGPVDDRLAPRDWPVPALRPSHVYRNGVFADSYRSSAKWIESFRPDVVLGGHWLPIKTDDAYFERLANFGEEFERAHRQVMALRDTEPHFGVDSMAGWMWPYRVHLPNVAPIDFEVTTRNPLAIETTLELRLTGPPGWTPSTARVLAPPRAEVSTTMSITPVGPCRRQPVTVELQADGRRFGQILEALVTVGGQAF